MEFCRHNDVQGDDDDGGGVEEGGDRDEEEELRLDVTMADLSDDEMRQVSRLDRAAGHLLYAKTELKRLQIIDELTKSNFSAPAIAMSVIHSQFNKLKKAPRRLGAAVMELCWRWRKIVNSYEEVRSEQTGSRILDLSGSLEDTVTAILLQQEQHRLAAGVQSDGVNDCYLTRQDDRTGLPEIAATGYRYTAPLTEQVWQDRPPTSQYDAPAREQVQQGEGRPDLQDLPLVLEVGCLFASELEALEKLEDWSYQNKVSIVKQQRKKAKEVNGKFQGATRLFRCPHGVERKSTSKGIRCKQSVNFTGCKFMIRITEKEKDRSWGVTAINPEHSGHETTDQNSSIKTIGNCQLKTASL